MRQLTFNSISRILRRPEARIEGELIMSDRVTLLPIDAADVTILVDNFVDILLPGTEMVRRAPLAWDWSEREQLIAEHGYSLLLTVQREGRSESVLYDAGLGRNTVLHNMHVLDTRAN